MPGFIIPIAAPNRPTNWLPEVTLLAFGTVGGWPGAILGQQLFRHKTQKQPFKTWFLLSIVVNISATAALYHFCPFILF
ncbi:DUF1294 domain-containing protein [Enterobacter bugandensis]|nr:DUF1294 domain-containing protein [Enterobacter bugandensis]MCU6214192.1 DUF1294 domain-containing protein [Enterobacter bugandensis]